MSELRRDPFSECWVLVSEVRAERPQEFAPIEQPSGGEACPFCRGCENETPPAVAVYPRTAGAGRDDDPWRVRVVPNKYPAIASLTGRVDDVGDSPGPSVGKATAPRALLASNTGDALHEVCTQGGVHEVIIESPDHATNFAELGLQQIELVLEAGRDRLQELRENRDLAYAVIFKNSGAESGASLAHVHSQLMALPVIPLPVQYELTRCYEYARLRGRSLMADVLDSELKQETRVVSASEQFVVYCPFASRFPGETWIVPRVPQARFEESAALDEIALLLRRSLAGLERLLGRPSYNFWIRTAPFHDLREGFRWRIEIAPRVSRMAGFELATGYFINPVLPANAAAKLRESWAE